MCGCTPINATYHARLEAIEGNLNTAILLSNQIIEDIAPMSNMWDQIKGIYQNVKHALHGSYIQNDYKQVQQLFTQLQATFSKAHENFTLLKELMGISTDAKNNLQGVCDCMNDLSAISKLCAHNFEHTSTIIEIYSNTTKHKDQHSVMDIAGDVMDFAGAVMKAAKSNPISMGINLGKLKDQHENLKKHFNIFVKGLEMLHFACKVLKKGGKCKFDGVFSYSTMCKNYYEKTMEVLKVYVKTMDEIMPL